MFPMLMIVLDQLHLWVSVGPNGTVYLGWYDRRLRAVNCTNDCESRTDTFAASFTVAGGVSPNKRLTSCSFSMNVLSNCNPNFGDYNGGHATADRFYYGWGDGRNGDSDGFSGGLQLILP